MIKASTALNLYDKVVARAIALDESHCVRFRNRNATCSECADACPQNCIALDEGRPIAIDQTACIGCGRCAASCPTDALRPVRHTRDELMSRCLAAAGANGGTVVIDDAATRAMAKRLVDPSKVVDVPSIASIDGTLLFELAAQGCPSIILVSRGSDDKTAARDAARAQAACDAANRAMRAWELSSRAQVKGKYPQSVRLEGKPAYDEQRRGFFTSMGDDAKKMAVATMEQAPELMDGAQDEPRHEKVQADGTLAHFLPEKRAGFIAAVLKEGVPAHRDAVLPQIPTVEIDQHACLGCRMCATFCPTGALFKYQDEEGTGVAFRAALCVGCHCCADICPVHAVRLSHATTAGDIVDTLDGGRGAKRFPMGDDATAHKRPHSMVEAMRGLIGDDKNIYER